MFNKSQVVCASLSVFECAHTCLCTSGHWMHMNACTCKVCVFMFLAVYMPLWCRLVCWSLPYHCTSCNSVTQSKVGSAEMSGCYSNALTDVSTEKYRMVKERRGRWVVSVQEWTEDERQGGRGTRPSQGWNKMKHHSYVKKEGQQEKKHEMPNTVR